MSPTELSYSLWVRDTASDLESVPQTFSSWDSCMNKAYCKWPVIAGIIVGGVILLTVVACIVNCLCCGIRCCTCCCSCCCPKPRPKRAKFADDPYHQPPPMPPVNNTYNNSYETGFQGGYQTPQAPPTYRGAQVARFDTPSSPGLSKMNEDALPAMPTWEQGVSRRVEDTSPQPDSVEMEPLNPMRPPQRTPSATAGGYMAPPQRTPSANSGGYMGPPPVRTPSAPRADANGYMRPPPIRTNMQNDYSPDPHGYDDQNPYDYHAQTTGVIGHSPYDQPYRDHSPGGDFHAMSPPDHAYSAGPQYPVGIAVSPTTEINRPVPFRQPSPGLPYRQASPGPGVPFRTNSPAVPPFRQASPGPGVPFRTNSPAVGVPPFRQPSPGFSQPSTQPPSYRAYSPASATPSSPPPPFSSVPQQVSDPGRPPSLLQSGRKPAPNSFRDV